MSESKLFTSLLQKTDCGYKINRNAILALFRNCEKDSSPSLEMIMARLAVIDHFYSTNMNKLQFGVSDLALAIQKLGSDGHVSKLFAEYAKNPVSTGEIFSLFNGRYRAQKDRPGRNAVSLISKYAYFVTGQDFPIYDKLVRDILYDICDCSRNSLKKIGTYIECVNKLKEKVNTSYSDLDNLLWLSGNQNNQIISLPVHYCKRAKNINRKTLRDSKK